MSEVVENSLITINPTVDDCQFDDRRPPGLPTALEAVMGVSSTLQNETPLFWQNLSQLIANKTLDVDLPPQEFLENPLFKHLVITRYKKIIKLQTQAAQDFAPQEVNKLFQTDPWLQPKPDDTKYLDIQSNWAKRAISDSLTECTKNFDLLTKATRDHLTGFFNKATFDAMVNVLDLLISDGDIKGVGIISFDMDQLKTINDTFGHAAGDEIFKSLNINVREYDLRFRIGGDEFVVLMIIQNSDNSINLNDLTDREGLAKRSLEIASRINSITASADSPCTISAGFAIADQNNSLKNACAEADKSLYASKKAGKNCFSSEINGTTVTTPFSLPQNP